MYIFRQFVGSYNAVMRSVGLAFQTLDHIVSEDAMAPFQFRRFVGTLPIAAGGEREERLAEVAQAVVQIFGILRRNRAAVAGVGEQDLPFSVDLAADGRAQLVHRIPGT